ncbi:MAG: 3'(2') 5'-bisphosphate nucleotidase [Gammaproteobacteria bacterium]|nr:MAG: 3'(2') 5'-bisphosphate nucleotidase [Gammaproteobacteria bacterium]TND02896.1 MAG: 3'(2'), 5'-bisphosphate nucleotidase [Gammaproteobacteria bacterium]
MPFNELTGDILHTVIAVARDAGDKILQIYNRNFDITVKADRSPLTEADMAAHEAIISGLKQLTPELPVLSEESASIPFTERSRWQRYWLVDPLDGTREFIKRNGEFTVNIALIDDHRPVIGVIYVPVSDVTYYAVSGKGAFKQAADGQPVGIRAVAWHGGTVRVAGSRSHRGDSLDAMLERIGDYEIISMGSSLKSCLVAEGAAHIYPRFGPTSEWDTAAAQCIVEEAGGRLVDLEMQPLRYNTKESLLNPSFFVYGDQSQHWAAYF